MVIEQPQSSNLDLTHMNYQEFAKLRVGSKTLDDATLDLGSLKKVDRALTDKNQIITAINNRDYAFMKNVSNFFYETSGIYGRLVRYLAYLYRYDWVLTPYVNSDTMKPDKVLNEFSKGLTYLDNFNAKLVFGDVALKVVKNGCYYGYIVDNGTRPVVQELPTEYCRTRYFVNGKPLVEFDVKFFDDNFRDVTQRMNVLKSFPKEFAQGYVAFKSGRLKNDAGDTRAWITLDPQYTCKFSLNGSDMPILAAVIPAIIDLDEAQELDKKKMLQELLKIVIQKMPIDKNGDLVFDVDEAQQLHNNAVRMLGKAIGIDVLTTFADVEVADMADKNTTTTVDELTKVERTVYNEAGVSQMQFNTDGNIALEKSILNDEAAMYNLLIQFESFLNDLLARFNTTPKKVYYRVQILTTTIYNYKEMAKLYKEQTQLGYSKMLPQIALGQSQSSILANAYFENDVLDLVNVFIPPIASNTMSADALKQIGDEKAGGRPSKESQGESVTEKTIQNKESQS